MSDPCKEFHLYGYGCSPPEDCFCDYALGKKAYEYHKSILADKKRAETEIRDLHSEIDRLHKHMVKDAIEGRKATAMLAADVTHGDSLALQLEEPKAELAKKDQRIKEWKELGYKIEAERDLWREKYSKANEIADEFLSVSIDTNVSEKIYLIAGERDWWRECYRISVEGDYPGGRQRDQEARTKPFPLSGGCAVCGGSHMAKMDTDNAGTCVKCGAVTIFERDTESDGEML